MITYSILKLCSMFSVTLASAQDASKHLELGKQMLSSGNLIDALSHFDSAVGEKYFFILQTVFNLLKRNAPLVRDSLLAELLCCVLEHLLHSTGSTQEDRKPSRHD